MYNEIEPKSLELTPLEARKIIDLIYHEGWNLLCKVARNEEENLKIELANLDGLMDIHRCQGNLKGLDYVLSIPEVTKLTWEEQNGS